MRWLFDIATLFSWMIAAVWTQRALVARLNLPSVPNLLDARPSASTAGGPSGTGPTAEITVIVPARNEGASIEATLRSLLAQTIPVEIIAVDDRSTDSTGAIMDRMSAESLPAGKSLSVIHVESLPAGWMGKTHAMALAARQTATPWLLFTDGDVRFRTDALERTLRYAQDSAAGHLVLLPTLILRTPGERMMAVVFYSLSLLAWRPWKIADPHAKRDSIGVGAFNLVRGDVYRAAGGFEAHPLEILEDVRLGFTIKSLGYRQCLVLGRNLVEVHWAAGALGMVHNLTKNIFAVFRFRTWLLLGACLGLGVLCFAPLVGLFAPWPIRAASLISLAMAGWLYELSSRHFSGISPIYTLTFPLGALLVLYAMFRSMGVTLLRRGVVWRGTFYPLRELRQRALPLR